MKKLLPLLLIFHFTLTSCYRDQDDSGLLSGVFVEVLPQPGRTQLTFAEGNRIIITQEGSEEENEFTYEIVEDIIRLTPSTDEPTVTELEFEYLDTYRFEIGNLYPAVPEHPNEIMTFERQ